MFLPSIFLKHISNESCLGEVKARLQQLTPATFVKFDELLCGRWDMIQQSMACCPSAYLETVVAKFGGDQYSKLFLQLLRRDELQTITDQPVAG